MDSEQNTRAQVMATTRICQRCGQPVSSFAPDGLCPNCLLESSPTLGANEPGAPAPSGTPPSPHPASGHPLPSDGRGAGGEGRPPTIRYFGDYELLEEIARGGMGVVYKARQVSLNRTVAVKMILSGEFASPEFLQRFRLEAEAAANLDHPNIVAIHEVGVHEGHHYFSMDYVAGQSRAERARDNPLPPELAVDYLKTMAEAIHYAHQCGILHRDLKPSNVLIDALDQPRITDFGLAKRLTSDSQLSTQDSQLTLTGQVLGSPHYMPPEQAEGKHRQATIASDIYSLGAILYHLLTGRPPFLAETLPGTLQQLLHTEPISPRLLNRGVPRDLETICLKCLGKEPARRYASAQELADELGRFLRDEPILARPISPTAKLCRWCRRNPAVASLAAVSLVLLLAVAIALPIATFRINRQRQRADQNAEGELHLWLTNAQVLLRIGKPVDAVATLTRALDRWPDNPDIWNAKAAAEEQAGRFEAARQSYSRSIDVAVRSGAVHHLDLTRKSLAHLVRRAALPGLLGWWRGEHDAEDEVSNQAGTLMNNATFATGKVGEAFNLDGVDDYVLIPASARLSITGALSIVAWINPQQLNSGFILAKIDRSVPGGVSYWFQMHREGLVSLGVLAPGGAGRETFSTSAVLKVGAWSHLSGTFDPATQALELYVNGVPVPCRLHGWSTVISTINDNWTSVRLGAAVAAAGALESVFSGLIDEVKLYNRVLSPAEIQADYNQAFPDLMPPRAPTVEPR